MLIIFLFCVSISIPILLISGPALPNIAIALLAFTSLNKNFIKFFYLKFSKTLIFIFIFFCIYIIIRSFLSNHIMLSLEASLFYFRFIFFSLGIYYLLDKFKSVMINYSFMVMFLCICIVSLDAVFQFFIGYNFLGMPVYANDGRISGIFNDELILGSYIVRLLPIIIALYFIKYNNQNNINPIYIYLFLIITTFTVLISGERVSIIYLFFILINIFFISSNKKIYFIIYSLFFTVIISAIYYTPSLKERIIDRTKMDMGIYSEKLDLQFFSDTHEQHILTSIEIFKKNIFFGSGPKTFREECKKFKNNYFHGCSTHTHNTYIQLLSETGLVGTIPVIIIFLIILNKYFRYIIDLFRKNKKINNIHIAKIFLLVSFVISLMPLLPSGNFFSSYLNIFYYLPLGYYFYIIEK